MFKSILRLPDVQKRTGLSRSTVYLRVSEGNFPRQIKLGPRCVGWLESEIDAWLDDKVKKNRRPRKSPNPPETSRCMQSLGPLAEAGMLTLAVRLFGCS